MARLKRTTWPMVETAVAEACAGPARSLLQALAALEQALEAAPLSVRAERLRSGSSEEKNAPA